MAERGARLLVFFTSLIVLRFGGADKGKFRVSRPLLTLRALRGIDKSPLMMAVCSFTNHFYHLVYSDFYPDVYHAQPGYSSYIFIYLCLSGYRSELLNT